MTYHSILLLQFLDLPVQRGVGSRWGKGRLVTIHTISESGTGMLIVVLAPVSI